MDRPLITKAFILIVFGAILYACFLIFRPFLVEMLVAAVLVSIFYRPFEWLTKRLNGRRKLASLIMCVLVALLVIIPLTNFLVYAAGRSVLAYDNILDYFAPVRYNQFSDHPWLKKSYDYFIVNENVKQTVLDVAQQINQWFLSGAASVIRGTTSFFLSLILIIFTMFFFFVDGEKIMQRLMYLTPLPNKYDKEIFNKFRAVSYSTVVSTFVTAIVQGLAGAVGFMFAGLPAFFAGIVMALFSLLPYIGASIIWIPAGVYLLIADKIWQGIFLLVWGGVVVSSIDNLLRAYIIKSSAEVHPIFIIFSILGGISLFGFWGVVFGPLIISLAVTILHIYELEYGKILEN